MMTANTRPVAANTEPKKEDPFVRGVTFDQLGWDD